MKIKSLVTDYVCHINCYVGLVFSKIKEKIIIKTRDWKVELWWIFRSRSFFKKGGRWNGTK